MKPPRVVLDTNVLISAFCFGGLPAKIVERALSGQAELLVSEALIEEFRDVLRSKFPHREAAIADAMHELSLLWEVVSTSGGPRLSVIKKDPDDDRVLECALAAGADFIVSGDKHLLTLKRFRGIVILTPREFLQGLGGATNS